MKNVLFTIIILCLITLASCKNNNINREQKIANDTVLIYKFFDVQSKQNISQASKMLLKKTQFYSYVASETESTQFGFVNNFYITEVAEEKESYSSMLFDLFQLFNHSDEDNMFVEIDSIHVDSIKYRVYQTIKSPLLEEYHYSLPKKIEDFYIENDTITKIYLQSINIESQTANFPDELSYWVYEFTGKGVFDYKSLILGKDDDAFKKTVIGNYRNYISFIQDSLDENYKYTFYKSLRDLHKKAFMTHELDDRAIELYLGFKGIELYNDPAIQGEDDNIELVHLNFSQGSVPISGVTRMQDSTAFVHLKLNQKCAVFGLGAKNMVGELQLKDVMVFSCSFNDTISTTNK